MTLFHVVYTVVFFSYNNSSTYNNGNNNRTHKAKPVPERHGDPRSRRRNQCQTRCGLVIVPQLTSRGLCCYRNNSIGHGVRNWSVLIGQSIYTGFGLKMLWLPIHEYVRYSPGLISCFQGLNTLWFADHYKHT